jgi:ATP-binding cassette subfamily B protein
MSQYRDLALYRRLLLQARPYWPHVVGIFVLSLLATPIGLFVPVPMKIVMDRITGDHPLPTFVDALLPASIRDSNTAVLALAAILFVAINVIYQAQQMVSRLFSSYTGEKMVLGFRAKLFRHVQDMSFLYHDAKGTTDSTYRIQYDAPSLQSVILDGVIPLVSAAVTLVTMVYVAARIDLQLVLVALTVGPILFFTTMFFRRRFRAQWAEVKKLESSSMSVVQEVLGSVRVVKAFGQEKREHRRFVTQSSASLWARLRLVGSEGMFGILTTLITRSGAAAILFLGAQHVLAGILTPGDLFMLMSYMMQIFVPLGMISGTVTGLQNGLASAERALSLLDEKSDVSERPDAQPLARAAGAFAFCNVCFAYDPEHPVLHDVSFEIPSGASVGIVGPTGAGKTTLVSLLARSHDPVSGDILLDGRDLRDYKLADLRNQFAVVLQEPVLFLTTIAENIAYARPDASREEIVAAATAAGAHDFISQLPQAYDTLVGERGMSLSGGERQRISLARAFLKDAPILILDEPTSSVDTETEAAIIEAMTRLMRGRTTFIISHRVSALENCNLLVELEQGHAVNVTTTPTGAANGSNGTYRGGHARTDGVA